MEVELVEPAALDKAITALDAASFDACNRCGVRHQANEDPHAAAARGHPAPEDTKHRVPTEWSAHGRVYAPKASGYNGAHEFAGTIVCP